MDGKFFFKMCEERLIPAVRSKLPPDAQLVIVQMDSAGGHSGVQNLRRLNELGSKAKPKIVFRYVETDDACGCPCAQYLCCYRCQPANSPDLNLLDLGVWHSIERVVNKLRRNLFNPSRSKQLEIEAFIPAVEEAWKRWNSAVKIGQLKDTLLEVWRQIVECNGGNTFAEPRKSITKKGTT